MNVYEIEAIKRDSFKKGPAKSYRRQGLIPSIIYGQEENTGNNKRFVMFTGTNEQNFRIMYRPVTIEYKTIYFCHGGQNEFNSTSNHTYNHSKAYYRPLEADSIYVTEVGLFDDNDQMIAYGKLSEPVEKNKLETITLKVELVL